MKYPTCQEYQGWPKMQLRSLNRTDLTYINLKFGVYADTYNIISIKMLGSRHTTLSSAAIPYFPYILPEKVRYQ